jgi:hypothetical protein
MAETSTLGPTTATPVSWQSAFWGLVPFALNSMTQPAGPVCGAPTAISFMLRSSPIICLIDTMFLLILYLYHLYKVRNFVEAHTRLLLFRFQGQIDGDASQEGRYRNLQKNAIFRIVVFLLILPQLVKLYAYSGLIGTQVVASMYLISFVIIEAVLVLPNKPSSTGNTPKSVPGSGFLSVPYMSITAASTFSLWFLASALRDIFDHENGYTLSQWIGIVVLFIGMIPSVPMLVYGIALRAKWFDVVLPATLWALLTGVPCAYYFAGPTLETLKMSSQWSTVTSSAFLGVWAVLGLKFASTVTKPMLTKNRAAEEPLESSFGWYFFVVNLITAALYYSSSYSPAGTSKPAWTDYLG